MSVLAMGRKYGVSDNAVRKWLRSYERAAGQVPSANAGSVISPIAKPRN